VGYTSEVVSLIGNLLLFTTNISFTPSLLITSLLLISGLFSSFLMEQWFETSADLCFIPFTSSYSFNFHLLMIFQFQLMDLCFTRLYNNINHPSKLIVGADFHCFKNKIEPKWEDPICANGGKWTISCGRGKSDTFWLHTVSNSILSER
jgi:ABC-type dipeptide/oligopeptide/nickel transport system permease component